MMRAAVVKLILLLSFTVNIAHDSIIVTGDRQGGEPALVHMCEQTHQSDCSRACQLHHVFHFNAILSDSYLHFDMPVKSETFVYKNRISPQNLLKNLIKPPIA